MRKKLGLFALFVAIVAVAGGAFYYWFGTKYDEEFLAALAARGVTYEKIEENESGMLTFVNPKLDVGLSEPLVLGKFTALKAQTGYDVTIENLDISLALGFADADVKLTLPVMEIKAMEFADKIDKTGNGLATAAYLSPFLHDKAASIRLENVNLSTDFIFGDYFIAPTYTVGEILLENIEQGKMASYSNKDITFSLFTGTETVTAKIASIELKDFNLGRTLEFNFLAVENPEAPFEEIYSSLEMKDYQVSQLNGTQTKYDRLWASSGKMRGAKKAPAMFFKELFALQDLFTKEVNWKEERRHIALIEDVIALIAMIGEQESVAEGMSMTQFMPEIGQMLSINVAQVWSNLKAKTMDFSYHDMKISTDMVDVEIGKIAVEDFSHTRLIDGLSEFLRNGARFSTGEIKEQELVTFALGLIPHFTKFTIEDFHLADADKNPYKDMIGEWSFKQIALTNAYGFEQALIPTSLEFEIKDISLPAQIYREMAASSPASPAYDGLVCLLEGKESVDMFYKIKADWDRETQILDISEISFGNNIAGKIRLPLKFGNVPEAFFSFSPLMSEEDYQEIRLKNIEIEYDAQGHAAKLLECYGRGFGMDGESFRMYLTSTIRLAILMDRGGTDQEIVQKLRPLINSLTTFVEQGGKISFLVSAKNEQGVSFKELDEEVKNKGHGLNLFDASATHTAP